MDFRRSIELVPTEFFSYKSIHFDHLSISSAVRLQMGLTNMMKEWLMADNVAERIENQHQLDNLILFIYIFLLILTILVIWLFKYIKIAYIHETGEGVRGWW